MALTNDTLRGLGVTTGTLWLAASAFAVAADQHYDGLLAHEMSSGGPRNFLNFQLHHVLLEAAFLTLLLGLHWLALANKPKAWRGYRAANVALGIALGSVIMGWADQLFDDYYHQSLFCFGRAERIWAIDVGWACQTAHYAREIALPITTLLLLVVSFALRRFGSSTERQSSI